jgi:hypothetical protein
MKEETPVYVVGSYVLEKFKNVCRAIQKVSAVHL